MVESLFTWLGGTAPGQFLAGSTAAFATTEALHIVGLAVVGGVILVIDLVALGITSRELRAGTLIDQLSGLFYGALALTAITGVMLVAAGPYKYYTNPLFPVKLVLLVAALILQITFRRRLVPLQGPDRLSRLLASTSLLLWTGVVVTGRWLGLI